jgi:hypothetical protein
MSAFDERKFRAVGALVDLARLHGSALDAGQDNFRWSQPRNRF